MTLAMRSLTSVQVMVAGEAEALAALVGRLGRAKLLPATPEVLESPAAKRERRAVSAMALDSDRRIGGRWAKALLRRKLVSSAAESAVVKFLKLSDLSELIVDLSNSLA